MIITTKEWDLLFECLMYYTEGISVNEFIEIHSSDYYKEFHSFMTRLKNTGWTFLIITQKAIENGILFTWKFS